MAVATSEADLAAGLSMPVFAPVDRAAIFMRPAEITFLLLLPHSGPMVASSTGLSALPSGGKEALMLMPRPEMPMLTRREREVLELVCERFHDKEIAEVLGISARTVQTHVAHLRDKFGVHSRDELREVAKDQ